MGNEVGAVLGLIPLDVREGRRHLCLQTANGKKGSVPITASYCNLCFG